MTSPFWHRWLQPLMFMGLFSCWLLFGITGWLWLAAGERSAAQQALEDRAAQQLQLLRGQLDALQLSSRQLLRAMEGARQQGDKQYLPYLTNYRGLQPQLAQLALLAANPATNKQLEVVAYAPYQLGGRLLLTQDLARQPLVAAVLPALQRGQAQFLLWQRRAPEQWLLLLPGEQGLTLAIWLLPQQLLPEVHDQDSHLLLSALPVVPQSALEGQNLFVQLPLRSGVFTLNLTLWQPWGLGAALGWRMLVLVVFLALLWWLGWRSWRFSCALRLRSLQIRQQQQQWLQLAVALAPVSVQGALATLERKVQLLPPAQRLMVWWVHGKGLRRRHYHGATAMLKLERQLLTTPFEKLLPIRLRHGGMLLVLEVEQDSELVLRLSSWLTGVMGVRAEEAPLLWQCFDVSHDVQALERAIGDAQWHLPDHVRGRQPAGR